MFELRADKNKLILLSREPVTSGSVNANTVWFQFSPDWEGMERTAVFRAGGETRSVRLDGGGQCAIPWEVLKTPGVQLQAGVYGTRGSSVTLPTIWVGLGVILEGAALGEDAHPPTPDLWEQALAGKGDGLGYTPAGELGLYAGDKLLSSVAVSGGGGGTSDHRLLSGRDAPDQHPIQSITRLDRELDKRVRTDNALSVSDIIKIMEG